MKVLATLGTEAGHNLDVCLLLSQRKLNSLPPPPLQPAREMFCFENSARLLRSDPPGYSLFCHIEWQYHRNDISLNSQSATNIQIDYVSHEH